MFPPEAPFFLESVGQQSNITGVFMGTTTGGDPCAGGEPTFLVGLRLTE